MALAQENVRPDEAATIASFIDFLKTASAKRHPTGPIQRFNQGRHSGCVQAEFTVLDSLGPELRVGFFAQARTKKTAVLFARAAQMPTDPAPSRITETAVPAGVAAANGARLIRQSARAKVASMELS